MSRSSAVESIYQCRPLEYPDSIRILQLLPALDPSSDISINLIVTRLVHAPLYEALSYTWATEDGDATLSSLAICNDSCIGITRNCQDALKQLRTNESPRSLWIDAICIHQNNIPERSHQVAIMRKIYSKATRVLIWLGFSSEVIDVETGLPASTTFLRYLGRTSAELKQWKDNGKDVKASPLYRNLLLEASEYISNGRPTPLIQGFLSIVKRSWWTRIWVVQEAALAAVATFVCSGQTVDYLHFYEWYLVLQLDFSREAALLWGLLGSFQDHMHSVYSAKRAGNPLQYLKNVYGADLLTSSADFLKTTYREELAGNPTEATQYLKSIYRILGRSRRLRATDPRDHIFGILGLSEMFISRIPAPDYNRTETEVFTDVARSLLTQSQSLYMLSHACNIDTSPDRPSWVVNWSEAPQFHIPVVDHLYHASKDSASVQKILKRGGELQVLGQVVDLVPSISVLESEAYRSPYDIQKAISGWQESCRVGLSVKNYPTGEAVDEVLWRTLCWNLDSELRYPAPSRIGKNFADFYRILVSDKGTETKATEILDQAATFHEVAVHSMPLCVTAKGLLASVPWTTTTGDRIAVLAGSQTPFVFRPTADYYRLIGACYVHGIMDGQSFPDSLEELQWLTIH